MIIGIPVYDDVDMLDVAGPYEMFAWAGLEVELVAERSGLVKFRNGFAFQVTKGFAEAGTYDALWVPGGDPDALARLMGDPSHTYLDFLIRQSQHLDLLFRQGPHAGYVASVCEGALLLAAAGLLDGYTATTHWAFVPCLIARFPNVTVADGHPRFHLDRNRLTGGGISSGLDEALKLIELLQGTKAAQTVQQVTQYYPAPPVASEIPNTTSCPVPYVTIPPPRAASASPA
jgi:transcriptional regulator GlxA family with amidase domain